MYNKDVRLYLIIQRLAGQIRVSMPLFAVKELAVQSTKELDIIYNCSIYAKRATRVENDAIFSPKPAHYHCSS